MANFENWKWVAEKLGVPTMFAAILCFAIYQTGSWTAKRVFEPTITVGIDFLRAEAASMKTIANNATEQTRQATEQTQLMRETSELTKESVQLIREMRDDQRKFPAVAEKMP